MPQIHIKNLFEKVVNSYSKAYQYSSQKSFDFLSRSKKYATNSFLAATLLAASTPVSLNEQRKLLPVNIPNDKVHHNNPNKINLYNNHQKDLASALRQASFIEKKAQEIDFSQVEIGDEASILFHKIRNFVDSLNENNTLSSNQASYDTKIDPYDIAKLWKKYIFVASILPKTDYPLHMAEGKTSSKGLLDDLSQTLIVYNGPDVDYKQQTADNLVFLFAKNLVLTNTESIHPDLDVDVQYSPTIKSAAALSYSLDKYLTDYSKTLEAKDKKQYQVTSARNIEQKTDAAAPTSSANIEANPVSVPDNISPVLHALQLWLNTKKWPSVRGEVDLEDAEYWGSDLINYIKDYMRVTALKKEAGLDENPIKSEEETRQAWEVLRATVKKEEKRIFDETDKRHDQPQMLDEIIAKVGRHIVNTHSPNAAEMQSQHPFKDVIAIDSFANSLNDLYSFMSGNGLNSVKKWERSKDSLAIYLSTIDTTIQKANLMVETPQYYTQNNGWRGDKHEKIIADISQISLESLPTYNEIDSINPLTNSNVSTIHKNHKDAQNLAMAKNVSQGNSSSQKALEIPISEDDLTSSKSGKDSPNEGLSIEQKSIENMMQNNGSNQKIGSSPKRSIDANETRKPEDLNNTGHANKSNNSPETSKKKFPQTVSPPNSDGDKAYRYKNDNNAPNPIDGALNVPINKPIKSPKDFDNLYQQYLNDVKVFTDQKIQHKFVQKDKRGHLVDDITAQNIVSINDKLMRLKEYINSGGEIPSNYTPDNKKGSELHNFYKVRNIMEDAYLHLRNNHNLPSWAVKLSAAARSKGSRHKDRPYNRPESLAHLLPQKQENSLLNFKGKKHNYIDGSLKSVNLGEVFAKSKQKFRCDNRMTRVYARAKDRQNMYKMPMEVQFA